MKQHDELHRYELMDERRTRQRRGVESAASAERRRIDRRGPASLADAPAVQRVFPLGEAVAGAASRRHSWQRVLLVCADLLAVALALAVGADAAGGTLGLGSVALGLLMTVGIAKAGGLYDKDQLVLRRSTLDEAPRLLQLAAVIAVAYWVTLETQIDRDALAVTWVMLSGSLVACRALARMSARLTLPPQRCLFLGDPVVAPYVKGKIGAGRANGEVVHEIHLQPRDTAAAFGGLEGLQRAVDDRAIDRVVIAPVSSDAADTLELVRIAKLSCAEVSIFPRLFEVVGTAVEFEEIEGMTLIGIRRFGLSESSVRTKRAFDLVAGGVLCLLALPLMAVIALAIRLDSPGPILFRQPRVGRDGRPFCIYKFRTMVPDADKLKDSLRGRNETVGLFKVIDDPRVTRVGGFLRRTALDELAQLINVLRGEMSLVGPRPLVDDEDDQILGLDRDRLHLMPGMTGPWQVMRSGRVPMHEMVSIDYIYVANWSLWTDLKLLLRTVSYVLARGGA